jgi:hypothetical protein
MPKGKKKFSDENSNKIARVIAESTRRNNSNKPWTALEFVEVLKENTKKSYGQKELYVEARRVAKHIRKAGHKVFIPQWRESHDLLTSFIHGKPPSVPE